MHKKPNPKKLLLYGFAETENGFYYETEIMKGTFLLQIRLTDDGGVRTDLTERETGDEYVLYKTHAKGSFVGSVRQAVEGELGKIADACFETDLFRSDQTKEVMEYVAEKYGDQPEFLWERHPDNAIWRRKDTAKWYGALLTVPKNKLGLDSEEKAVILNLHVPAEEMQDLLERGNYYPGWHMNKKHWVTVILDGSVDTEELCRRIDESYFLAKKANKKD